MARVAPDNAGQTAMQAAIAAAVAKALNGKAGSQRKKRTKGKGRAKLTDAEKAVFMAKNDAAAVEAFTAAGYEDVQPRVNVLTYDKWIEKGRKVIPGQKSVKVGPFSLFHITQTAPVEQAAA